MDAQDPHWFLRLLQTHYRDIWCVECRITLFLLLILNLLVLLSFPRSISFRENQIHPTTIICIPQSVSLGHRVVRSDVETHVLHPSKVPGDYNTLNGKRVAIVGNDLCTKEGFAGKGMDLNVFALSVHDLLHAL